MSTLPVRARDGGRKKLFSRILRKKEPKPLLERLASLRLRLLTGGTRLDTLGTFIDDYTLIFNHADDSDSENSDPTHFDLSDPNDVLSVALHDAGIARNAKIDFPDETAPLKPWAGLTYELLVFPKYVRLSRRNTKAPRMLDNVFLAQQLRMDEAPALSALSIAGLAPSLALQDAALNKLEVLAMEFLRDGKYLAVAGRDAKITIWQVMLLPLSRLQFNNYEALHPGQAPTTAPVFHQEPVMVLEGHTSTILALDWSKNNFLVSGSMDRTVRLWHVDRPHCLQTFEHNDFVTLVRFHPTDDRFFLSGSLDNQLRLWLILESNVAYSKDLGFDVLITALAFTPSGTHCIVGGFNGSLFALETQGLNVVNRVEIKKNKLNPFHHKETNKITGVRVFENPISSDLPPTQLERWNLLITTNDSRIRLIDLRLKNLVTRFKGFSNGSSSIVASLSEDNRYILCGSEDQWCYVWENNNATINDKLKKTLRDVYADPKQLPQEKHGRVSALFHDNSFLKKLSLDRYLDDSGTHRIANENNSYTSFHAFHSKVNVAIFAPENTKKLLEFSDDTIFDLVKRGPELEKYGISPPKGRAHHFEDSTGLNCGHIIVTCDQYGTIKVFRQDSAYYARKALTEFKKSHKCTFNYTEPLNPKNMLNLKLMKSRSLSPAMDGCNIRKRLLSMSRNPNIKEQSTPSGSIADPMECDEAKL